MILESTQLSRETPRKGTQLPVFLLEMQPLAGISGGESALEHSGRVVTGLSWWDASEL